MSKNDEKRTWRQDRPEEVRHEESNKPKKKAKKKGRFDREFDIKGKRYVKNTENPDPKHFKRKRKLSTAPEENTYTRPKKGFGKEDKGQGERPPRQAFGSKDRQRSWEKPLKNNKDRYPDREGYSKDTYPRHQKPKRYHEDHDGAEEDRPNKNYGKKPKRSHYQTEERNHFGKRAGGGSYERRKQQRQRKFDVKRGKVAPEYSNKILTQKEKSIQGEEKMIRLNRFVANAGVCSRREADTLIAEGRIKVNGEVVTQMGTKVAVSDTVSFDDKPLNREVKRYVLLNKPKGYITTMDDPYARKIVTELVESACEERIYPVGRLDRESTGLLIFTNDGELADKLSHPSFETQKIYHVRLDRAITKRDLEDIRSMNFTLEDGPLKLDGINLIDEEGFELGIELHSGRNRVVRRLFAHFGYEVERLDRTVYAGLTKKDLPRGKWRHLNEQEVIRLKHFKA